MGRKCGRTKSTDGKPCEAWAIRGGTVCRVHGGSAPQVKAKAKRQLEQDAAQHAAVTYGLPREIAPDEALIEEVHRTAGHVAYLGALVAALGRDDLKQYGVGQGGAMFERPAAWVELYQSERAHLVTVCKAALAAGIAERHVQLAERQGEMVGELLRAAIDAMGVTPQQQEAGYRAVRDRLSAAA